MVIQEVHELDVKTVFELTFQDAATGLAVDISSVSVQEITFQKPDGTNVVKTTVFVNTGTDGKTKYVVADATVLTPPGNWKLQGRVKWSTGDEWRTDIHEFRVYENL